MEKDLQKRVSDLQKNVIDCIAAIYENLVLGHKYQLSELNEADIKFPNAVFEEFNSASIRYTGPRWAIGLLAEGLRLNTQLLVLVISSMRWSHPVNVLLRLK